MYKTVIFILFIILTTNLKSYSYTIFDTQKDTFLEYIRKSDEKSEEKQEKLDAQIQIDLNINNIELDLNECLDIALQNNINLKIAKHTMEAAKWEFNSKLSEFLPDVSGSFSITQLRGTFLVGGVAPDLVKEYPIFISVLANYDAFNNNKIFFETRIKNFLKKAKINQNNFTRDEVILNTTLLYYELLGRKLSIDVLHTNMLDREEQLRTTKARYEIGLGEKFDVLRAEAQVQIARKELVQSLNDLRFAQAKLARIMGLDVLAPIYPKDNLITPLNLFDDNYDIEKIYEIAMKIRPDIMAKELELRAKRTERNSNWGDFIPRLNVYYQYTQSGLISTGVKFGDTLGLELQVPIGEKLGVKTFADYKIADENYKKSIWELEKYKRDIKEKIMQSVYNSTAALEKIEASKKEVAAAQLSLDMALVRLDIGEATFLDVIEAQATKTQAREGLIKNVVEYNKAQVQLLFDAGIITVYEIIKEYNERDILIK